MKSNFNSEFALINKIVSSQTSLPNVIVPNGDDAAVIKMGDTLIAISTDSVVEGKHFSFEYYAYRQVGIKAVESAVSDIIAIGAIPTGIVVALSLSKSINTDQVGEIYQGIKSSCARLGISLLGGDVVTKNTELELTVTAIGYAKSEKELIRRNTAKPHDLICVTGNLGGSHAGLRAIQKNIPNYQETRLRHLEPNCRIDLIGKLTGVSAGIDISDGLSSEIQHLCTESGYGAIIQAEKIPLHKEVLQISELLNENPINYALNGGEDYELLLAIPPHLYRKELGVVIGEFTEEASVFLSLNGAKHEMKPNGFDHLR